MMRLFALTCTAIFLAAATLALAEDPTRESYTAQVEPICKANTQANERILRGVRSKVRQNKLSAAGTQFIKASRALRGTHAQLKAVPQPPADTAKLTKWLGYIKTEANLFKKAGDALKDGNKIKAQRMVVQLTRNANLANNTVFAFDFRYCRFEPSKFT
jgi:hypothetical protein